MDESTARTIERWTTGRGVKAGRTGPLIEDDIEALDRFLGRRSTSEERKFMKSVWDAEQSAYEEQSR